LQRHVNAISWQITTYYAIIAVAIVEKGHCQWKRQNVEMLKMSIKMLILHGMLSFFNTSSLALLVKFCIALH
jgi:hypothetical protein